MTPLTRVLRRLRGPWVADSPAPDLSWLDRKDGLDTRRPLTMHVGRCGPYALPTRYDAVMDSGPEAPGGDLAAMAAPLPGMARDDLGTYAEPVEVHIEADVSEFRDTMDRFARAVAEAAMHPMYRIGQDGTVTLAEWTEPVLDVPADPPARGRHRQTDPLDLILADLHDLGGLS